MHHFDIVKNTSLDNVASEDLVDIQDVSVDKKLSRNDRIAEYVRQIKNPLHFKCGKFTIKARYAVNGISLEECLRSILS